MSQLTLSFEPSIPERWPSLREYVAYRAQVANKHMKVQAALDGIRFDMQTDDLFDEEVAA